MNQRCALVMAGGTGGHIFPGLAVADGLRAAGWRVHWLGAPGSMEAQLVPPRGYAFEPVAFGGVRGKGMTTLMVLPLKLLRAFWQSLQVLRRVKPNVLVGMGGYITFPGALMGVATGRPLVLHEQNSVAGMANKVLAGFAARVFTAFPGVLAKARQVRWIGNPLREPFLHQPPPAERFAGRSGPLRLLVVVPQFHQQLALLDAVAFLDRQQFDAATGDRRQLGALAGLDGAGAGVGDRFDLDDPAFRVQDADRVLAVAEVDSDRDGG